MLRLLFAAGVAVFLILSTAGTAFMATITNDACSDGASDLSYTYDSVSNLITSMIVNQDASTRRSLTITLVNPANGNVAFTGTRNFGTGSFVYDLSPLGSHMVAHTDKLGNPSVVPPFTIQCAWGPAS